MTARASGRSHQLSAVSTDLDPLILHLQLYLRWISSRLLLYLRWISSRLLNYSVIRLIFWLWGEAQETAGEDDAN